MNMKNQLVYLSLLVICTLSFAWTGRAQHTEVIPDSLLTRDYIYEYTFSDTVKARRIIGLMRERQLAPAHVLDVAEGDLLFNNGKYHAALPFYEKALHADSIRNNDEEYMDQLHRMISCYDCLHDEEMKARYVEALWQKATDCGNQAMQSIARFNMGKMVYYQENKERGYEMIREAIALMEAADYKYKYDNLRYNYNSLFIMQQRDKRYEEALETLDCLEKVVEASTQEEPEIKDLNEKELKTLYANRAVVYSRLGRMEEADQAYRMWKTKASFYTKDDYLIAPYLMDRKMYDEVIRIYAARESFLQANRDTINYHMLTIKRSLGYAYAYKKDFEQAARYFREWGIVTDSLKVREQQSAALELAEAYKTNEQALQLSEQAASIHLRNVVIFLVVAGLVVAVGLIIRIGYDNRVIQRKNTAMVKTIHELLAYKDEVFRMQEEKLAWQREAEPGESPVEEPVAENETSVSEADRSLYERLNHEIISRRLYLRPDFSKKELLKEVSVPVNKFSGLFKQFAGCSFTQYIQELRLDHAVRLMSEQPSWTLDAIAKESQMSKSAFYSLFQKKYGIKPAEFRRKRAVGDDSLEQPDETE